MNARDLAFQAFAYSALEKLAKEQKEPVRVAARDALAAEKAAHGTKAVELTLPDGTVCASASLAAPKDRVEVTDEDAFFEWVLANHPAALKVDYTFKKSFLDRLEVDGDTVADPITGQVIDFARFVPARDAEPGIRITATRSNKNQILDGYGLFWEAFARGDLAGLDLMGRPELPGGESQ